MADRLRVTIEGDSDALQRAVAAARLSLKGLGQEVDRTNRQSRSLQTTSRATSRELDGLGRSVSRVNAQAALLRNTVAALKFPSAIAGAGLLAQALSAAAGGAVALTSSLAPLSGALAAYPALGSAVAQGMGVVTLALKDAQKESRALRDELKLLKELQGALQREARRGLYPGLQDALASANTRANREALKVISRRTGAAAGRVAAQAGRMVGSEAFTRDLLTQGNRNVAWLERGGTAALRLGDALRHVTIEAGPLVDWMTRLGAQGARQIDLWARAGRESGTLRRFFRETRETLSVAGPMVWDFGRALVNIGRAGKPLGDELLVDLRNAAAEFRAWTDSARGRNVLAAYFERAEAPVREMGRLVADVTKAFFRLGAQPGVTKLLRQIRTEMLPVLEQVVGQTTAAFGPHLIAALTSVVRLFGDLAGSAGPLTVLTDTIRRLADALHWAFQNIPGLRALTVTAVSAAAVGKIAAAAGKAIGLEKLGGGLFGQLAKRGSSPANPLFVADVTGGGAGGRGGGRITNWLRGPAGLAALRAATAGAAVAIPASALALLASKVNKDLPTGKGEPTRRAAAGRPGLVAPRDAFARVPDGGQRGSKAEIESMAAVAVGARSLARNLRALRADWQKLREGAGGDVRRMRDIVDRNLSLISNTLGEGTRKGRRAVVANFEAAAAGIRRTMSDGRGLTERGSKEIERLLRVHTTRGRVAVKGNMDRIIAAISATMRRGGQITDDGLRLISRLYERSLRQFGFTPKQAAREALPGTRYEGGPDEGTRGPQTNRARGGLVQFGRPGDRGSDRIPVEMGGRKIMVGSGEVGMVATADQQAELNARLADMGGLRGLFRRKNRAHWATPAAKMAKGGWVGASPAGLNPAIKSIGLWAMRKYGAVASSTLRPGDSGSYHAIGAAADLTSGNMLEMARGIDRAFRPRLAELIHTPLGYSVDNGRKTAPFAQADHYDHVHAAAFGKALAAIAAQIGRVKVDGPQSALRSVIQGALDKARKAANKKLDGLSSSMSSGDIPQFSGDWVEVLEKIAASKGWSARDWKELVRLESGGNPNAVNPSSGASGLGQFLGSTLDAYRPYGAGSKNPVEQIHAMAKYIEDRYTTPSAALAFHHAHNWYERGGPIDRLAYVGDSLGVGTAPLLAGRLKGVKFDTNVKQGRGSPEGAAVLARLLSRADDAAIFDLGTNDPNAATLRASIARARSLLGDRPLLAATVHGPAAAAKNKMLRSLAGIELVDWAVRGEKLVGPDGIHGGYGARAGLFAAAIRGLAGHVGADDTRPDNVPLGHGTPSLREIRRQAKTVQRAKDRFAKARKDKKNPKTDDRRLKRELAGSRSRLRSLRERRRAALARRRKGRRRLDARLDSMRLPPGFQEAVDKQRATIDDKDALYQIAESGFRGDDVLTQGELDDLVARQADLRGLVGGNPYGEGGITALLERWVVPDVQERIRKLGAFIGRLRKRVQDNLDKIKAKRKRADEHRDRIGKLRDAIKKTRDKKKKTKADERNLERWGNELDHRRAELAIITERDIPALQSDNVFVAGDREPRSLTNLDSERTLLGGAEGALGELSEKRDEWVEALRPGQLLTEWSNYDQGIAALLREGATKPDDTAADAAGPGGDSLVADLLREQLAESQRQSAISAAQFQTLAGMLPFVGKFAQGGIVGRTGLALVHRDETILPDPRSGFGSQLAPAGRQADRPIDVTVNVMGDGMNPAQVEVLVEGKIARHRQQVELRSRTLARGPGRP